MTAALQEAYDLLTFMHAVSKGTNYWDADQVAKYERMAKAARDAMTLVGELTDIIRYLNIGAREESHELSAAWCRDTASRLIELQKVLS